MIDTDHPDGASIVVPDPVEIPPAPEPVGIPVPEDLPRPETLPPRETGVSINDPLPERVGQPMGDPLLP